MRTTDEYKQLLDPDGKREHYQPIEHPAFRGWRATQPCAERWQMIQECLLDREQPGVCLDIGCNTGWFSRQFSRAGWSVVGIDTKSHELELAASRHMQEFAGPVLPLYVEGDVAEVNLPSADVVLCLSMVMYLFNSQFGKTTDQAWAVLQRIGDAAPMMFLDYGGMYCTLGAGFPGEVLERTHYTRCRLLGHTALNRPLYQFTR